MSTEKNYFSYHIFYFPFKWNVECSHEMNLSEQIDINRIELTTSGDWERTIHPVGEDAMNLYNEKNYYYKFVHRILYDNKNKESMMIHLERREPQDATKEVRYVIKTKKRETPYSLKVEAINLNLYATGVGFLSFYLGNDKENQSSPDDILYINQFGRRIMPPFFADIVNRCETAEYIQIEGLGEDTAFHENFNYTVEDAWKPASFITELIKEAAPNISFEPVIDDRMFVTCWYKNDKLCKSYMGCLDKFMREGSDNNFWYRFMFVDSDSCTCLNDEMRYNLLKKHTYPRWEGRKSLYGCTRYSMMYLADTGAPDYLFTTFETIYARMVELVLMQRASMLRFSEEVTKVSYLSNKEIEVISKRVSSLYKEYIHFVNQIYFREVTAQEQGIELYDMLQKNLQMEEYVKDLDEEIGELHQYISLMDDRDRNKKATLLNNLATFFLPISVITGFWGMNKIYDVIGATDFEWQVVTLIVGALVALCFIYNRKRKL